MNIAVGGLSTESCTFSPLPTRYEDFSVLRGGKLLPRYPFLAECSDVNLIPIFHAGAGPGGSVPASDYGKFKDEFLTKLREVNNIDGVYLDMHGALHVTGMLDAELDWVREIRDVVGDRCLISASYDLHGNLSENTIRKYDFLTAYRTAPHVDAEETRERAFRLLLYGLRAKGRMHKAYIKLPLSLPGEQVVTTREPGKAIYNAIEEAVEMEGVSDASILTGYVWADEPRNGATVVALGENPQAVNDTARQLARRFWDARAELEFETPAGDMDFCLKKARESGARPFFISDAGDNPTGGGAGDNPYPLERVLTNGVDDVLIAAIADAGSVKRCFAAGEEAVVPLELGGKLDPVHGKSLRVDARVLGLFGTRPGVRKVIILVDGARAIITEERKAYTRKSDFNELGIDLLSEKLVIIKLGYLFPEIREIAADSCLAFTPGATQPEV
ncbi:MAG: M81 family metallopeptidase, partial [Spirochaetales bacterium]|nr:M81 family metallopeptidase [Spirochaetales bacterium]